MNRIAAFALALLAASLVPPTAGAQAPAAEPAAAAVAPRIWPSEPRLKPDGSKWRIGY